MLVVLAKEGEAQAAAAEAAVLESAAASLDTIDQHEYLPQEMQSAQERTAEFIWERLEEIYGSPEAI